jgi:hypothetical protein
MNTSYCISRLALGVSLWLAVPAYAFIQPTTGRLPDLDRRFAPATNAPAPAAAFAAPASAVAPAQAEMTVLRQQVPGVRVDFDPYFGTVASVRSTDGFLTPAPTAAAATGPQLQPALIATEPERVVRGFLDQRRTVFGHGAEALDQAPIKQQFTGAHNGLRTVVWQQEREAIPVYQATLVAHVTAHGELVSMSSGLLPGAQPAAPGGPTLSAPEAAARATAELGGQVDTGGARIVEGPVGPAQTQRLTAPGLKGEATVQLFWLPMSRDTLRLCWQVVFTPATSGEMFLSLVDAKTGEVMVRRSLTDYATEASFRVFTSDSPTPLSPGYATPTNSQPPTATRQLITFTALNTNASPSGWIEDTVNETRGNNVDAHLDRNDDDVADLPRPQGSPFRVFDPPLDLTQSPVGQGNAAVVQLFYTCNWMHDRLYDLGFTEAAGNFQINNFGRGGLGNDALQADAQDGSGTNNANMSTPPDGMTPRMQMYLFNGPTPDRDGDFDTEVVLHEYAHGLSNRRVGGGAGLSASQSRGMGEGWSDFYPLALLSEPGDDLDGIYASGAYVSYLLDPGFTQNYYYGIRRYPYTTDLNKNPLTFKDIDPDQASSHAGVPFSPLFFSANDSPSEVHNQGEVWCAALWEVRANLIRKYGHTNGNQLALQLVTDGLALSPANPNFIQARDAILQADLVGNAGTNHNELWLAFAKRGLGWNATSPASSTTTGVVESYDLPDTMAVSPAGPFISSGPVGGPFLPASFTLVLTNVGSNSLTWSLVNTSTWLTASSAGGTLSPGGAAAQVTLTPAAAANALTQGIYATTVLFSNQSSHVTQSRSLTLRVGQPDTFTELFNTTDNDLNFQSCTFTPDGSPGFYSVCREAITNFPTPPGSTEVTLADDSYAQVTLTGTNTVAIYHRRTNVFFIGSNGYLTIGSGDANMNWSLASHFNRPRVSALFDDLNPETGGAVYWQQLADRAVVSFVGVPQYGLTTANSFQVELFFDGRIRLSYLALADTGGLVGLSAGTGVPVGFLPSDFSSYGSCSPPLRLAIPTVATEGAGVLPGAGLVQLTLPVASNVVVTLRSSATTEVTVPGSLVIPAGQTNGVFDLTILDDARLDGSQPVNVEASALGFTTTTARIVVYDNETASLSVVLPPSVAEGAGSVTGSVVSSAPPDAAVAVALSSSDLTELWVPTFVILPAGQTSVVFTASVVDDSQIDGPQSVTVTAHVENWKDGSTIITVLDNESLALTLSLPASVAEDAGPQTNAGRLTLAGTLATNLVVTLASGNPLRLTVPATVTVPAGQTSAFFNLTPVNNTVADGNQVVAVTATAPGMGSATNSLTVVDDDIAPVILTQPVGKTVYVGNSVAFTATAFGQNPLAWQWRFNSATLPGKTAATLNLTGLTTNQSGAYTVLVTNALGSATSAVATLTVKLQPTLADALDTPSQTWLTGGNAAWFAQPSVTHDGEDAARSGAITNSAESWLETVAVGPGAGTFWWKVSSESGWDYLTFATNSTTITEISGEEDWQQVTFFLPPGTNTLRWTYSKDSILADGSDCGWLDEVVLPVQSGPPTIIQQPSGLALLVGEPLCLAVLANGEQPLAYQWRRNGQALPGDNLWTLTRYAASTNDAGTYTVVITNALGAVTSAVAVVSVQTTPSLGEALDAPQLTWLSGGAALWIGQTNTSHDGVDAGRGGPLPPGQESWAQTTVTGPGAVTFWCQVDYSADYSSYDTLSLLLDGVAKTNYYSGQPWQKTAFALPAGQHTLRWRLAADTYNPGIGGKAWLDEVTYYPPQGPPQFITQPVSRRLYEFNTVSFQTIVVGATPLALQWRRNDVDLPGATNAALVLTNVQVTQSGEYVLAATNALGFALSQPVTLTVLPTPPCAPPAPGLVAWWRAEGNGFDSAGFNHAAFNYSYSTSYPTGLVGRAFGCTSYYLSVPAAAELNLGSGPGLTLECWLRPSYAYSYGNPFIEWNNGTAGVVVSVEANGVLRANFRDTAGASHIISTAARTLTNSVWQHVAASYDRSSGLAALYVNGSLVTQTNLGSFTPRTMGRLYLGGGTSFSPTYLSAFGGYLDELSLYSRALTAAEIQPIAAANFVGKCIPPPACVPAAAELAAWWRGESNTLDSAGINVALNTSSYSAPKYDSGVAGAALLFDYSTYPLRVPAETNLDIGARGGLSIEGWFRPDYSPYLATPLLAWATIGVTNGASLALMPDASYSQSFPVMSFGGVASASKVLRGTNTLAMVDTWNHVAATYDRASGLATLYLNGAISVQTNLGSFTPGTRGDLYLGGAAGGTSSYFEGALDEMSLYSRALTTAEVRAIFRAGAAGKCPVPPACVLPPEGLAGWWRGESNTWDSVSTNHGLPVSSVGYSPGIVGRGFNLQTSGYLRVPANSELNVGPGPGLTLESWVNPTSSGSTLPIAAWGNTSSSRGVSLSYLYGSPAGRFEFSLTDLAGVTRVLSSTNGSAARYSWQQVVATYDKASGLAALYSNGRLLVQTNLGSFTPVTTNDFYLGYKPYLSYRFYGWLDELALYNRALSAAEVRGLAFGREAGKCRIPPTVVLQPTNTIGTVSSNATLSVTAAGNARLRYQWQRNGLNLPGATAAALTITNVQLGKEGAYAVRITNWFGVAVSSNAVLSLNFPPQAGLLPAATFTNTPITISLGKLLNTTSDPDGDALTVSAVTSTSTQGGAVQLGLLGATYQPALDFLGLDRFTYTVSDGRGGAATGTVEVGVLSRAGLSGNMLPAVTLGNGQVQVRFLGVPGRTYIVQRATQLPGAWTTLGTTQTSASGLGLLLDTNPLTGQAFYRTVYP